MLKLTLDLISLDSAKQRVTEAKIKLQEAETDYSALIRQIAKQLQSKIDAGKTETGSVIFDKLLLHAVRSRWIDFGGISDDKSLHCGRRVVESFETAGQLTAICLRQITPSIKKGGDYQERPRIVEKVILGRSAGRELELIEEDVPGKENEKRCVGLIPHFSDWATAQQGGFPHVEYSIPDPEKPLSITDELCGVYVPLAVFKKVDIGSPQDTAPRLLSVQILDHVIVGRVLNESRQTVISSTGRALLSIAHDQLHKHPIPKAAPTM